MNGEEREIFVYYGETYEDIRVRKQYSELSNDEQLARIEKLEKQDSFKCSIGGWKKSIEGTI